MEWNLQGWSGRNTIETRHFVRLSLPDYFPLFYFRAVKNPMDFLFGKRKTPAELMRQHQRALQRAQREMDRERSKLEQQEKKLIIDIKNTAKKGQMVRYPCFIFILSCRFLLLCIYYFFLFHDLLHVTRFL